MLMHIDRNYWWLLLVGCFLCFFGIWLLPVTDPVESNYVLTAKEMLQSGDILSPRIYGHYWYDKPVFFYWELIAAFRIMGLSDLAARFFPAVFGMAGIVLTYFFGKRIYDKKTGFIAAVVLASSLEYWCLSKGIVTDMTLFLSLSATLVFFYLGYREKSSRFYYLAYIAMGISVLDKGPIGICLPGLIIIVFLAVRRDWQAFCHLKMASGLLLTLLVSAVWYVPMYMRHGQDFIDMFFGVHNVLRATVSEHPEYNVWYYYLAVFLLGFFPWTFSLPAAVHEAWKKRQHISFSETEQFLLIWAVVVFLVFQSFATKYITYTFPYMMPLALLLALFLRHHRRWLSSLALAAGALYMAALFLYVAPTCNIRSAQGLAAVLQQVSGPEVPVVYYGGDYPASLVYYSGREVERLVPRAQIAKLKPHRMSWSAKNVMPFQAIEDLAPAGPMTAIMDKKSEQVFLRDMPGVWQRVAEYHDRVFYERD
jgi:4-amino-4-deoxy-L-arabinose transferase-like glycosyltransferase